MERSFEQYFRQNHLPHLWCPGCGNGIAMKAIVQAVRRLLAEQPENSTQAGHYRRFLEGASAEALAQGEAEVRALQEESRRIHQPVKLQCELERLP